MPDRSPRTPPAASPSEQDQDQDADSPHNDTPNNNSASSAKKRKLSSGRTSQACTRCRSLKMKCIGANDPPCRRCRRTGASCDFIPRANAARPWSPGPYPSHTCTELWRSQVTQRLKQLEAANARFEALFQQLAKNGTLSGINPGPTPTDTTADQPSIAGPAREEGEAVRTEGDYQGVLQAIERLKDELPSHIAADEAWSPAVVCPIWESFRSHMPGLHFFSGQVSFVHPTPLLAVAILYVGAAHIPSADLARHQPVYFKAFTRAVATLAVPDCPIRGTSTLEEDGPVSAKFDDVLAIILVGLLAVGWVDTLGMWVNTAYRLLLDGTAEERGRRQSEWRGLWEGLRTIELEHSSLHLICPALPRSPPDPPFSPARSGSPPMNAGAPIGELLEIMQRRMPRFVGRGLPTVWETVCLNNDPKQRHITAEPDDMAAIRSWAIEIDTWYSRCAADTTNASLYVRSIILLNYHLHKLFVFSIFFPLLGVAATGASEREPLLESSRVVLKIEASGFEVWSSWDLVIITNASLILLQAWASGAADQEDLNLIQNHLNLLTCTQQAAPSLRHMLASRLETALQEVRTPVRSTVPLPNTSPQETDAAMNNMVSTWSYMGQQRDERDPRREQPFPPRPTTGFMPHAPDLGGLIPDLPPFDLSDPTALTDWPPFLLNFFGDQGADGPAPPPSAGPQQMPFQPQPHPPHPSHPPHPHPSHPPHPQHVSHPHPAHAPHP